MVSGVAQRLEMVMNRRFGNVEHVGWSRSRKYQRRKTATQFVLTVSSRIDFHFGFGLIHLRNISLELTLRQQNASLSGVVLARHSSAIYCRSAFEHSGIHDHDVASHSGAEMSVSISPFRSDVASLFFSHQKLELQHRNVCYRSGYEDVADVQTRESHATFETIERVSVRRRAQQNVAVYGAQLGSSRVWIFTHVLRKEFVHLEMCDWPHTLQMFRATRALIELIDYDKIPQSVRATWPVESIERVETQNVFYKLSTLLDELKGASIELNTNTMAHISNTLIGNNLLRHKALLYLIIAIAREGGEHVDLLTLNEPSEKRDIIIAVAKDIVEQYKDVPKIKRIIEGVVFAIASSEINQCIRHTLDLMGVPCHAHGVDAGLCILAVQQPASWRQKTYEDLSCFSKTLSTEEFEAMGVSLRNDPHRVAAILLRLNPNYETDSELAFKRVVFGNEPNAPDDVGRFALIYCSNMWENVMGLMGWDFVWHERVKKYLCTGGRYKRRCFLSVLRPLER